MEDKVMSRVFVWCTFLVFIGSVALAQQQPQPPADPLGENLFPPELVMQYQQAIGLGEEQKNLIKAEVQKAQTRFTELQWPLHKEVETMISLVKEPKTDEQQVLTQLDKILELEREIKRTHFTMVVRIKNSLTPEQQARLREIKNRP
jgi:Spy/CpxP family protein refolding chaperone